ncbi:DUF1905 domain-containing protein [Herbiconiux sp. P17]|uniref:DUF1905 domain-containing protein n=1 Tax=Herbiconiux wuyangfengii TaxID=3342794 RepID=UPI0035BB0D8A
MGAFAVASGAVVEPVREEGLGVRDEVLLAVIPRYRDRMELGFRGDVWYWRGPSPFHFVTVPAAESELIAELAPGVSYGWGMIPVTVRIGRTEMATSLWPKDGAYIVPLKTALRERERIELGDELEVNLIIRTA